jgi:hypothetical protein
LRLTQKLLTLFASSAAASKLSAQDSLDIPNLCSRKKNGKEKGQGKEINITATETEMGG